MDLLNLSLAIHADASRRAATSRAVTPHSIARAALLAGLVQAHQLVLDLLRALLLLVRGRRRLLLLGGRRRRRRLLVGCRCRRPDLRLLRLCQDTTSLVCVVVGRRLVVAAAVREVGALAGGCLGGLLDVVARIRGGILL